MCLVLDRLSDYQCLYSAVTAIGSKFGIGSKSLRMWTLQCQIDSGQRHRPRGEQLAEIMTLQGKVSVLMKATVTLKQASIFFAGDLYFLRS
jgi:transposase-like protein